LRRPKGAATHLIPVSPAARGSAADTLQLTTGQLYKQRSMIRYHLQKQPLFLDAVANLQHSSGVDAEFNSLDAKVAQFVGLCERLRAENHDLRQQLATAKNDAKRLNERIEGAKVKLESLLARLPD
jgi:cell division protein ZapB